MAVQTTLVDLSGESKMAGKGKGKEEGSMKSGRGSGNENGVGNEEIIQGERQKFPMTTVVIGCRKKVVVMTWMNGKPNASRVSSSRTVLCLIQPIFSN